MYNKMIVIIFLAILLVVSCQKGEKEEFKGEEGGTVIVGSIEEVTNLNPLYPSLGRGLGVENMLFLSLHGRNAEGKIVPQLAESWIYSEDFKSITYYLRRDVEWSDGEKVTAEDVKFTFDLIKDASVGSPLAASVRFIDSAKVLSPYSICFYFRNPYADELLDSGITPLPKHILEDVKDIGNASFNESPIGNGPYKLQDWKKGQSMVLVANENYYKGKPPLDKVVLWFAGSQEELAYELLEGNVDIVTDVTPSLYEKIKEKKDVSLIVKPGNTYTYIGWNLEEPLFSNRKMRRAFTYAINREKLVEEMLLDMADVAKGPIPPTSWAYDKDLSAVNYNPQEAAKLLDEMGWELNKRRNIRRKDGKELSFTLITNKENPVRIAIANYVSSELSKLGVDVKLNLLSTNTFIERLVSGDYDAFILGWQVKEKIDPTMVWNSDPEKGKFNLVSYKNPKVDSMIDRGLLTLDRRETKKIWAEFQRIIVEDIPATFLFYPKEIAAASKRVNGISSNDKRFILSNLEHYWIPSSLRTSVEVASLGKDVEVEKEEEEKTEEPVVKPEVILEKKAKEEAVKKVTPKPEVEPTKEGIEKGPVAETTPEKGETTEVVKEPEPEKKIPPTEAKIKRLVIPDYPKAAKMVGAQGNVFIQVLISKEGKVKRAKIIKSFGNPTCDDAALKAARATLWKPATKNGKPVESTRTYPVRFPP
jgi:peptide/nickel transport system substrate-binding protein